jgi:hypothetical protein
VCEGETIRAGADDDDMSDHGCRNKSLKLCEFPVVQLLLRLYTLGYVVASYLSVGDQFLDFAPPYSQGVILIPRATEALHSLELNTEMPCDHHRSI